MPARRRALTPARGPPLPEVAQDLRLVGPQLPFPGSQPACIRALEAGAVEEPVGGAVGDGDKPALGVVVEAGLPSWLDTLDELAVACRLLALFDCTLPFGSR